MKTLVICYSLTGHTRQVARKIAQTTDAAFGEIRDVRKRHGGLGFMRSGFESLTGRTPAIYEPANNIAQYDLVILATPLWAGRIAAPMKSYLTAKHGDVSRYGLVITHDGSPVDRAVRQVAGLTGQPAVAVLDVVTRTLRNGSYKAAVAAFCASLEKEG